MVLNISEIRAYSYKSNAYQNFEFLTSSIASCSSDYYLDAWTGRLLDNGCQVPVEPANGLSFFNIVFDVERFVHTVTIVGNSL